MVIIDARLTKLEQQQTGDMRCKGIRVFQQSEDTSKVFYELPGVFYAVPQGYTRADLHQLRATGWQLITVVYGGA